MKGKTLLTIFSALAINLALPIGQMNRQTLADRNTVQPTQEITVNHQEQATKTIKTTNNNQPVKSSPAVVSTTSGSSTAVSQASVTIIDPSHPESYPRDVMTIDNSTYQVADYHGNGIIPDSGKVYHWTNAPRDNWFLLERTGTQANMVQNLRVGTKVVVNQKSYQVYDLLAKTDQSTARPAAIQAENGGIVLYIQTTNNHKVSNFYVLAK